MTNNNPHHSVRLGNRLTKLLIGEAINKSRDKTEIIKEALELRYQTKEFENPKECETLIKIYDNATPEQRKYPGRI